MEKKKTKKGRITFWSSEKILSISAILVSIGTFAVFAYQTNLMRKQQHMSVYPHLQFHNYSNYSKEYKYVLTNKGVGPALVTLSKISINGETKDQDLADYLHETIVWNRDSINFSTTNIRRGLLIAEKETIELVALWGDNSTASSAKLFHFIHNDSLEYVIEYESIYGEKWRICKKYDMPKKIE